jgi:hypothetical protein
VVGFGREALMEQDASGYVIWGLLLAAVLYMSVRAALTYFFPKQNN